jgi:hypothetical protein
MPHLWGRHMDERFYRDRARVLRELADEADPFIKKRLLLLAKNYEDLTTGQATRGHAAKTPAQGSEVDGLDGS